MLGRFRAKTSIGFVSQDRGGHLQSECSSCSLDVPTLNTRRPDGQENGKTEDRENFPTAYVTLPPGRAYEANYQRSAQRSVRSVGIDRFQVVGGNGVFYCPPMPTSN